MIKYENNIYVLFLQTPDSFLKTDNLRDAFQTAGKMTNWDVVSSLCIFQKHDINVSVDPRTTSVSSKPIRLLITTIDPKTLFLNRPIFLRILLLKVYLVRGIRSRDSAELKKCIQFNFYEYTILIKNYSPAYLPTRKPYIKRKTPTKLADFSLLNGYKKN